jgi:hypothetical protein
LERKAKELQSEARRQSERAARRDILSVRQSEPLSREQLRQLEKERATVERLRLDLLDQRDPLLQEKLQQEKALADKKRILVDRDVLVAQQLKKELEAAAAARAPRKSAKSPEEQEALRTMLLQQLAKAEAEVKELRARIEQLRKDEDKLPKRP